MTQKSNCCGSELKTHCEDEGTCYYSCMKCGKACDPVTKQTPKGCGYCKRSKYRCKRHIPKVTMTTTRIYTQDQVDHLLAKEREDAVREFINKIRRWTKGKAVTKDKLREFLNKEFPDPQKETRQYARDCIKKYRKTLIKLGSE